MKVYRATMDEIGHQMIVTEHESRIDAIITDQEDSGWIVRKMWDNDEGDTITEFRSDRGHFAISAISERKADAQYIVQVAFETGDDE